ncbi:hypothetical protein ACJIZ3_009978 [Penstemon smallii]|uniref:Uncharacterized protein n=1 Tax=Penstemon smallii TaxID=265156 RepID=A0ABD3TEL6_9LAMI
MNYASIMPLFLAFLIALLILFAVRTSIVTWITVVVLLAFAGKRRRMSQCIYLVQVVVMERSTGLLAFGCVTIVSLIVMAWLRVSDQTSFLGKLSN